MGRPRPVAGTTDVAAMPLLPMVFDDDPRPFHGVMPFRDGTMLSCPSP
jgi:hypothetical protein